MIASSKAMDVGIEIVGVVNLSARFRSESIFSSITGSLGEHPNNSGRGRSKNGVVEPSFATDWECPLHGIEILLLMLEENGMLR